MYLNWLKNIIKKVLFNLAPARSFDTAVLKQIYSFVVNEMEASMVTGLQVETDDELTGCCKCNAVNLGCEIVVITLGARGSLYCFSRIPAVCPCLLQ